MSASKDESWPVIALIFCLNHFKTLKTLSIGVAIHFILHTSPRNNNYKTFIFSSQAPNKAATSVQICCMRKCDLSHIPCRALWSSRNFLHQFLHFVYYFDSLSISSYHSGDLGSSDLSVQLFRTCAFHCCDIFVSRSFAAKSSSKTCRQRTPTTCCARVCVYVCGVAVKNFLFFHAHSIWI